MFLAPNGKVFNAGPSRPRAGSIRPAPGRGRTARRARVDFAATAPRSCISRARCLMVGGTDPPIATADKIDLNLSSRHVAIGGTHGDCPPPAQRDRAARRNRARDGRQQRRGVQQPERCRLHGRAVGSRPASRHRVHRRSPARLVIAAITRLPCCCRTAACSRRAATTSRTPKCFLRPICSKAHVRCHVRSVGDHLRQLVFRRDTRRDVDHGGDARCAVGRHALVQHESALRAPRVFAGNRRCDRDCSAGRPMAPPGHYMLFVLNAAGVPSIGANRQGRARRPAPAGGADQLECRGRVDQPDQSLLDRQRVQRIGFPNRAVARMASRSREIGTVGRERHDLRRHWIERVDAVLVSRSRL